MSANTTTTCACETCRISDRMATDTSCPKTGFGCFGRQCSSCVMNGQTPKCFEVKGQVK